MKSKRASFSAARCDRACERPGNPNCRSGASKKSRSSVHTGPSSPFASALSLIRDEVAASDLLPPDYSRYRPLLADGLRFFLERLPLPRLSCILGQQMALPPSAPTAERLVAILHHAPALHKLGQVVARDRRLDNGFRQQLQTLESLEPRTPMQEIRHLLGREFPKWRSAEIELESAPLAEGSVAVVMPFTWRGQAGVLKLLKPGIDHRLSEDLQILGQLGQFLDENCEKYHLPALDYRETFETIRELLLHEIRLEEEQRHLAEAARTYTVVPGVIVPALLPFCSPRVTAMQRIDGVKIAEAPPRNEDVRRSLAHTIAQALIVEPLFSEKQAALFHADPHAGNLLRTAENKIGILDWSLAGRLRKTERVELAQLMLGAAALDRQKIAEAIDRLSLTAPGQNLPKVLEESLRELQWGSLPGFSWLTGFRDQLVMRAGVRFTGSLLLFRKSLLTLEGVMSDLLNKDERIAGSILDQALLGAVVRYWNVESTGRLTAPLESRAFRTHLATKDVLEWFWSAPLIAVRWWNLRLGRSIHRCATGN